MGVDLSVEILGFKLKNPLILSSGPRGWNGEALKRAAQAGAGAVVTKTISFDPAEVPRPCIVKIGGKPITINAVINAEKWSDLTLEDWVEREIKIAKEGGVPVIGSIWAPPRQADRIGELAEMVMDAGADMIEVPGYSPKEVISLVGKIKENKKVDIPVITKLALDVFEFEPYIEAAEKAGADAISGIDTMGPALDIDVETGKPVVGSETGFGRVSGQYIFPFALYWIARTRQLTKLPILGVGGITKGTDVIKMMMAGANAVQMHTIVIIKGYEVFQKLRKEIEEYLERKGYSSIQEIIGYTQQFLVPEKIKVKYGGVVSKVDPEKCTGCKLCTQVCCWDAIHMVDKVAVSDPNKCYGCGMCVSVCPTNAITLVEK
ncbi:MAG: 4Fe-4S binding protein [Candidatus Asgardarchaeum sp.]